MPIVEDGAPGFANRLVPDMSCPIVSRSRRIEDAVFADERQGGRQMAMSRSLAETASVGQLALRVV
jgi:hypothetical protein